MPKQGLYKFLTNSLLFFLFLFTVKVHDLKVQIANFKASLQSTSALIQEPKELKLAMKELYKKYLKDYTQVC